MTDEISKFFGLDDIDDQPVVPTDIQIIPNDSEESDEDVDYKLARANIQKVTELAMTALEDITILAPKLQNYKAYESISALVKSTVDANKDLAELSRKKQQLSKYDEPAPEFEGPKNVTNNLFVGTTSELFQLIAKNMNEEKSE